MTAPDKIETLWLQFGPMGDVESVSDEPMVAHVAWVKLCDHQAAVAAAYEKAAHAGYVACAETRHVTLGNKVSDAIRALATPDQIAALAAERAADQAEIELLLKNHNGLTAEIARLTAALATAREDDGNPRPIETAPKDGTMLRLLVDYEGVENWMPLTDDNQSWTIGFNDLQNIGEDEWVFVGWNWSQDCFGTGEGKVIGWLPREAIKGATT